jgi:raffinose/stachyose/melibiose transport system substrate-binding protein
MKKTGWSIVLIALVAVFGTLTGCSRGSGAGKVYVLNFKPEIDQQWQEVARQYTAATGVAVKVVTAAGGTYEQTLRAEISKSDPPTIFNINGPVGYQSWKNYAADLKGTKLYEWLGDKGLAVSGPDGGVYGIPWTIETYGIIYNDAILRRYVALPNRATAITGAADIKNFATLKAVVEDMQRNRAALGIAGAFASTSFAAGEDWRWQTHLANLPIYYEYRDKKAGDAAAIDFSYAPYYKNIFDLYINNSVSQKAMLGNVTVDMSMAEFALGRAAFVQNGNWGWGQIATVQGNTVAAADVKFLPVYTGVPGEESQGLCTGTENFFCINSKSSAANREASIAFLEWLFNSPEGKRAAIEQFGFTAPFTTFGADERPADPLAREMFRYIDNPAITSVTWNFVSFPSQAFKDELGAALYQYALGTKSWDALVSETKANWAAEKANIR